MEIWGEIPEAPGYSASTEGRIKNAATELILKPGMTLSTGYLTVSLLIDGRQKSMYVHRLVASTFIGPVVGLEVNHLNGRKYDNSRENLDICTRVQNIQHAYDTKLYQPRGQKAVRIVETGEEFPNMKLCADAIDGVYQGVASCLAGRLKTYKGYTFERITR